MTLLLFTPWQTCSKTNGHCEAREGKNNRRCAMAGFGGLDEEVGLSEPKRRALLFLKLFLFRFFGSKK